MSQHQQSLRHPLYPIPPPTLSQTPDAPAFYVIHGAITRFVESITYLSKFSDTLILEFGDGSLFLEAHTAMKSANAAVLFQGTDEIADWGYGALENVADKRVQLSAKQVVGSLRNIEKDDNLQIFICGQNCEKVVIQYETSRGTLRTYEMAARDIPINYQKENFNKALYANVISCTSQYFKFLFSQLRDNDEICFRCYSEYSTITKCVDQDEVEQNSTLHSEQAASSYDLYDVTVPMTMTLSVRELKLSLRFISLHCHNVQICFDVDGKPLLLTCDDGEENEENERCRIQMGTVDTAPLLEANPTQEAQENRTYVFPEDQAEVEQPFAPPPSHQRQHEEEYQQYEQQQQPQGQFDDGFDQEQANRTYAFPEDQIEVEQAPPQRQHEEDEQQQERFDDDFDQENRSYAFPEDRMEPFAPPHRQHEEEDQQEEHQQPQEQFDDGFDQEQANRTYAFPEDRMEPFAPPPSHQRQHEEDQQDEQQQPQERFDDGFDQEQANRTYVFPEDQMEVEPAPLHRAHEEEYEQEEEQQPQEQFDDGFGQEERSYGFPEDQMEVELQQQPEMTASQAEVQNIFERGIRALGLEELIKYTDAPELDTYNLPATADNENLALLSQVPNNVKKRR